MTACAVGYQYRNHPALRGWLTWRLHQKKKKPSITARDASEVFANQEFYTSRVNTKHTHGNSAAVRTNAVIFIRQFILTLGLDEYAYSMSHRDQVDGVSGYRPAFWGKDLDKLPRHDVWSHQALSMVDVDFHVEEMEELITGSASPIVLSTINPVRAASAIGEASYYFDESNHFCMKMVGGGSYRHKLWDYTSDILHTTKRRFGVITDYTVFKVEKRQLDDYRQIVLLAPIGTWSGIWAWMAKYFTDSTPLTRFEPVTNGWTHIVSSTPSGISHSLGQPSTHLEASFTASEFEHVLASGSISKLSANTTNTSPWLKAERERGLVAAAYLQAAIPRKAAYATRVEESVRQVTATTNATGDEIEKTSVSGFMQPIIDGACYAHTNTRDNCKWGVEARITSLAKETQVTMAKFPTRCVREYVDFLTRSGPLTPESFEEVYTAQNRPSQRTRIAEGCNGGSAVDDTVRSFPKKEAYQGIKDPRIISTLNPLTGLEYSHYLRAVGSHLKTFEWYAFKSPATVAARMAEMLAGSDYAIEGDFSRMDGNVDRNVRSMLESRLLRKWFPGDDAVLSLHRKQYNQTGVIYGHTYDGGYARLSGSPETSAFNTLLTGAVVYTKNRMIGMEPTEAFANLGLLGGDDSCLPGIKGLDPSRDADVFKRAAKHLGQTLTSDIKLVGQPVVMLSRVFGGAWFGSTSSMCSPLRALSKVHSTANMPPGVTAAMKCHEKGLSLLSTDANTPVVGDLARKMISTGEPIPDRFKDRAMSHWSQFDTTWPNAPEDWMTEVIADQLPTFDYKLFGDWCANGEPLEAPVCMVVEEQGCGKRDVLVDGELVPSDTSSEQGSTQGSVATSKSGSGRRPRNTKQGKKGNRKPRDKRLSSSSSGN